MKKLILTLVFLATLVSSAADAPTVKLTFRWKGTTYKAEEVQVRGNDKDLNKATLYVPELGSLILINHQDIAKKDREGIQKASEAYEKWKKGETVTEAKKGKDQKAETASMNDLKIVQVLASGYICSCEIDDLPQMVYVSNTGMKKKYDAEVYLKKGKVTLFVLPEYTFKGPRGPEKYPAYTTNKAEALKQMNKED